MKYYKMYPLSYISLHKSTLCIKCLYILFLSRIYSSQGAGTEEACLVDILASRSNDEIKAINAFYKKSKWALSVNRISDRSLCVSVTDGAPGLRMISDIAYQ